MTEQVICESDALCSCQHANCNLSKEVSSSEDELDDDTEDLGPQKSNKDDSGIQPDDIFGRWCKGDT